MFKKLLYTNPKFFNKLYNILFGMKEEERTKVLKVLEKCESFTSGEDKLAEIQKIITQFGSDAEVQQMMAMLVALGNPDRMLILFALKEQDRCVCELELLLDKTQPAVSHHLKRLEEVNLIRGWKKGKFTHYSLVESSFNSLIQSMEKWMKSVKNWFG